MLAAILDPAHRMADLHGDRGDGDVFRHDPVLAAEAAADVGRDDADLVLRQAERLRQADPHHMAALGGEVHHQLVVAMIPVGQHAAAFERHGRLPVHAELAAQPHRRGGSDTGSPSRTVLVMIGVVRPVIEQRGGCPASSPRRIDDRRQRLELELDLVGQILGLGAASAACRRRSVGRHSAPGRRPAPGRGCGDARRVRVRLPGC